MGRLLSEKRKDRIATAVIRSGGILVILVVIGIVVNISLQAVPLFLGADQGPLESLAAPTTPVLAGSDSRREQVWAMDSAGVVTVLPAGDVPSIPTLETGESVVAADQEIHDLASIVSDRGRLVTGRVRFRDRWDGSTRTTIASWRDAAEPLALDPSGDWVGVTANASSDGDLVAAAWSAAGDLVLSAWDGEDEIWSSLPSPHVTGIRAVAIAEDLRHAAVVDRAGDLHVVTLPDGHEVPVEAAPVDVAAVRYLIGGGTLVAAGEDGALAVLLTVPRVRVTNRSASPLRLNGATVVPGASLEVVDDQVGQRLASRPDVDVTTVDPVCRAVRILPSVRGVPEVIAPSHRGRGFLVGTSDGRVGLFHSTSGRRLLTGDWGGGPVSALAMDPKADGAVAVVGGALLRRSIDNPHPEASFTTLFMPVWYEGYARPEWVWQSTGGSDASEPKLSLWPLIFGTLKATLYAMLLSVPIALMAAVYVSRLAPPWFQTTVKPTLELMAAVPSVVVGFLAALWLAPRLEQTLLASLVGVLLLPLAVVLGLGLWRLLPEAWRRRAPGGIELVVLGVALLVLVAGVPILAGGLERWLFDGDFQRWLFTDLGIRYDQRNSIVVGLALGFAVIPVIFTIAEDACSAVPDALVNASRALGATRWQTAVHLVVPAASPGLFAAVMLGLGRAVGETMIVLMAAGNTPLLDASPFNGMRTMSAAIAVEIPEAPVGGTLFRVLFLTGTLLFIFTLALTTVADTVGSHLRKRYARF